MHRAMRLRCLLRSPLWRVPAANPAAASSGGGASLARRLGAPPPRPFGENRRLCRFYSSKEGVGSAEAEAVGTGGGGSGSGSREQEHARLGERDQQEWLSGEGFLTGCKRRESPFLTKRDRFRKEFLRRAVPWDKTGISWNSFPYYVDQHAKQLLSECVASHLRHKDLALEYGSGLQSSTGRILLQSLPGTELYRERFVRALANELHVPLLVLDSSVLAPYDCGEDCSESEEEDNHAESEDEGSESEVDGKGDEKSGESNDDNSVKSVADLKKLVPCTLEEFAKRVVGVQESSSAAESSSTAESSEEEKRSFKKGDRVKYVGASVVVEADNRIILGQIPTQDGSKNAYTFISGRTLSNGQRGEVYEINGDQVAVIFDHPEEKVADGNKDEANKEENAIPAVYWVDTQDIEHDHDTQAEDWHIAIEALCEVLPSLQPAIIYFPDSSQWLSRAVPKSNRREFVEKVEEMLDQLTGPLVLICGQNIVEPSTEASKDNEPKTLLFHTMARLSHLTSFKRLLGGLKGRKPSSSSDITKLFKNRLFIPLPKDDEQMRVFNNLRASPRHRRFLLASGTLRVPPKALISPAMASSGGISDQLFVSVKLESPRLAELDLHPHLFGSHPVAGSWDPCKALPLERAAAAVWDLCCVVPSQHEPLNFKFVLKQKNDSSQCIVEEGPNLSLGCQSNEVEMRTAVFKLDEGKDILECKVQVETEILSPFDLAASWRAHQEYLQRSRVRGAHDVTINTGLEDRAKNGFASGLEHDLEKYVVPTPNMGSGVVYAANLTENPRSLLQTGSKGDSSPNHYINTMKDATGGHAPSLEEQRAMLVDRGVGSPNFARPTKETFSVSNFKLDSEAKDMPAAEGAVAAAAVADQMYGPKEDRKLTIVLVGLPARGKTFTAAKLTRYLRWLGHETKHFNVGKYRRLKHGTNQTADFFRGDNREGVEARNEVAALAMEDMLSWMQDGGQVGIFDATNSTRIRRNMLMKMAEGKCKIIFLETLCNDKDVLERNIRLKVQQSPDYAEQTDFEAGVQDFKERLTYYEKVYEPVEEGSYIKMIDMVSGKGGRLQINDISGYLPGRIVFFLVNCHLTPRPILLTRHGESMDNVRGRIGGDSSLSEAGQLYSRKLASFVEKRLKSERTASIWTSTLQRTILTAHPIIGFPKIQWRALDEINAGVCDGMTYDEIKKSKPEEYVSRRKDKLRYRYPRGESYLDVIQRLEPVIIELERQRAPVVVIAHQAVLRALYAYFADKPLEEVPNIEIPLHTIIEIQMGVAGVQEKRYKLMDAVHPTAGL